MKDTGEYIKMYKGGCLSRCSEYFVMVTKSGDASYFGSKFARRKGEYSRKLNKAENTELWKKVEACEFAKLKERYDEAEDSQQTTFTYFDEFEIKKITYCRYPPKLLKDLDQMLQKIAGEGKWSQANE